MKLNVEKEWFENRIPLEEGLSVEAGHPDKISEQPKDPESGRMICSSAHPMPPKAEGRWMHPEAKSYDGYSDYYDYYNCPACGLDFKVELPE